MEGRAAAYFALRPNSAAMGFDDVLGDGESQASATSFAGASGINAIKPFKNPTLICLRNTDSGVGNGKHGHVFANLGSERDAASGRRILDGIIEEVLQHFSQTCGVAPESRKQI